MINTFTIACSTENLIHIRAFVNESLKGIGLRTTDLNLIVLAIDEVCANLIIHSNDCDQRNRLSIFCDYNEKTFELRITIKDEGVVFDYDKYTEPELAKIIQDKRKGGVGLLLVRKIMDEMVYTANKEYNITRLVKRINPASLEV